MSWSDFFAHKCLRETAPSISSSLKPSLPSPGLSSQRIAALELELQHKNKEIEELKDTITKWDQEKANQFNKIKQLFEQENNELRAQVKKLKATGKEREELLANQMNEMKQQHKAEVAMYENLLSTKVQEWALGIA